VTELKPIFLALAIFALLFAYFSSRRIFAMTLIDRIDPPRPPTARTVPASRPPDMLRGKEVGSVALPFKLAAPLELPEELRSRLQCSHATESMI
jgi:hypothetical protein